MKQHRTKSLSSMIHILVTEFLPDNWRRYINENVNFSEGWRGSDTNVSLHLRNKATFLVNHIRNQTAKAASEIQPAMVCSTESTGIFTVKSATKKSVVYRVDFSVPSCQCIQFKRTLLPCKHFMGVFLHVDGWDWSSLPDNYKNSPYFTVDPDCISGLAVDCIPMTNVAAAEICERNQASGTAAIGKVSDKADSHDTAPKQSHSIAAEVRDLLSCIKNFTHLVEYENPESLEATKTDLLRIKDQLLQHCPKAGGFLLESTSGAHLSKMPRRRKKQVKTQNRGTDLVSYTTDAPAELRQRQQCATVVIPSTSRSLDIEKKSRKLKTPVAIQSNENIKDKVDLQTKKIKELDHVSHDTDVFTGLGKRKRVTVVLPTPSTSRSLDIAENSRKLKTPVTIESNENIKDKVDLQTKKGKELDHVSHDTDVYTGLGKRKRVTVVLPTPSTSRSLDIAENSRKLKTPVTIESNENIKNKVDLQTNIDKVSFARSEETLENVVLPTIISAQPHESQMASHNVALSDSTACEISELQDFPKSERFNLRQVRAKTRNQTPTAKQELFTKKHYKKYSFRTDKEIFKDLNAKNVMEQMIIMDMCNVESQEDMCAGRASIGEIKVIKVFEDVVKPELQKLFTSSPGSYTKAYENDHWRHFNFISGKGNMLQTKALRDPVGFRTRMLLITQQGLQELAILTIQEFFRFKNISTDQPLFSQYGGTFFTLNSCSNEALMNIIETGFDVQKSNAGIHYATDVAIPTAYILCVSYMEKIQFAAADRRLYPSIKNTI